MQLARWRRLHVMIRAPQPLTSNNTRIQTWVDLEKWSALTHSFSACFSNTCFGWHTDTFRVSQSEAWEPSLRDRTVHIQRSAAAPDLRECRPQVRERCISIYPSHHSSSYLNLFFGRRWWEHIPCPCCSRVLGGELRRSGEEEAFFVSYLS